MKSTSFWGRILRFWRGAETSDLQGILPDSEFRRILEYERALSDRHERRFSLLVFSAGANTNTAGFNRSLIGLLKDRLRMTDVVGWVEGGRIGVILPYSAQAGAQVVADDVCTDLLALGMPPRCEVHTYPLDEHKVDHGGQGGSSKPDYRESYPQPHVLVGGAPAASTHHAVAHSESPVIVIDDVDERGYSRFLELMAPPLPRYKRVLDVAISLTGIILLSPVWLTVAALIKIVSPGPVFFKQERVGYLGGRFLCWKFRTMKVAAETGVHQSYFRGLMQSDAPMTKLDVKADNRLIPFGKFIRASGIDELPQLVNVLRGEMSFVGPRPCIEYEYSKYQLWHKRRFDTLPGLTGLWQVSGKNKTTFSEMMRLDVSYARSKSLQSDLNIVWRTFPVLLEQVQLIMAKRGKSGRNEASA